MSRYLHFISVFILAFMAVITISAFVIHQWLYTPLKLTDDYIITVKKGDTLSRLAKQLEREEIIPSARLLVFYAQLNDKTKLEIGEYLIPKSINQDRLLQILHEANSINYSITLVEGKTFKDFITALQRNPRITATLDPAKGKDELLKDLGLELAHPEGWFFPDTYRFVNGATDQEMLLQAHQIMQTVLEEEWANKSPDLPYQSPYEALIMASIIEKETGVAHERSQIAGVFVRRLQKGMRLQTDPTIIYGLGDSYKGNIRRKHLTQYTPYNTYVIDGLPPTPIAMPGREAIHAALHPASGKSLYFVAKGDGSHQFSETLREHNKAVYQYQIKNRKKNYQSAPQQ